MSVSKPNVVISEEEDIRRSLLGEELIDFKQIELLELEWYLKSIPDIISRNLRKTYLLPDQLWQLQQTNGYRLFRKGLFPSF